MPSAPLNPDAAVTRIALGSCYDPYRPGVIFNRILATDPDLFVFLGDNVYAKTEEDDPELKSLVEAYAALAAEPHFQALRAEVPVLPIWDDHDYGLDDAGGDWPHKLTAEALYEHVWAITDNDPRAQRPGTYFAEILGPVGQRVQLILLDTRFFRTPLTRAPAGSRERYTPSNDPNQNMLGEAQWRWLENELRKPAELRIIVSTLMLMAENHHLESWQNLPQEKQRLIDLVRSTKAEGVVIASGDSHAGALFHADDVAAYPLHELNASSMNVPLTLFVPEPSFPAERYRDGEPFASANFGLVDIDWAAGSMTLRLLDELGNTVREATVAIASLR
jgi:alkaline phosphatase D